MPVLTVCPGCRRKIRIADDLLGHRVKCPSCRTTFRSSTEEDPQPPPEQGEEFTAARQEEEAPPERHRRGGEGVQAKVSPPPRPAARPQGEADEDEADRPRRRPKRRHLFASVAPADWRKVLTGLNLYLAGVFVFVGAVAVLIIGLIVAGSVMAGSVRGPNGQVNQGQLFAGAGALLVVFVAAALLGLVGFLLHLVGLGSVDTRQVICDGWATATSALPRPPG